MNVKNFIVIVFSKHIFMISLIFLYLPLFKYLCGNLELMKVSSTAMFDAILFSDLSIYNIKCGNIYEYVNDINNVLILSVYNIIDINGFNVDIKISLFNILFEINKITILSNELLKCFGWETNFNALESTDYWMLDSKMELNEVFFTSSSSIKHLIFYPLQKKIYIPFNETSLVFFRMINTDSNCIHGITTYTIFPSEVLPYIRKLQCFCFDELRLGGLETVDLPVLFYIEYVNGLDTKLTFCYTFLEIKT